MAKRGNGEGTIYKRENGTWCGMVTVGRKADGNLQRKTFYGKKRNEVQDKIHKYLEEHRSDDFKEPTNMTLAEWLDMWMLNFKKPTLRPNTYSSYDTNIRVHLKPQLGHILLKDLTLMDVQKFSNFISNQGKSTALLRKLVNILHSSLKSAIENGLISKNATNGVKLPEHTQKTIRVFTKEEERRFIQCLEDDAVSIAFKLDIVSGLRLGELTALTWDDVDFENGIINVDKTVITDRTKKLTNEGKAELVVQNRTKTSSSKRSVPIPVTAIKMLKLYKQEQEKNAKIAEGVYKLNNLVFSTSMGTLFSHRNVERSFYRLAKNAGIEGASVHSLRHTFATRLFELGVPAKTVSKLLGHKKVGHTLDIYTHVLPNIEAEAVQNLNYLLGEYDTKDTAIDTAM